MQGNPLTKTYGITKKENFCHVGLHYITSFFIDIQLVILYAMLDVMFYYQELKFEVLSRLCTSIHDTLCYSVVSRQVLKNLPTISIILLTTLVTD